MNQRFVGGFKQPISYFPVATNKCKFPSRSAAQLARVPHAQPNARVRVEEGNEKTVIEESYKGTRDRMAK